MVGNSTRAARAGRESVEERKQRLQHIMCRYADTRLEFRKTDCLPNVPGAKGKGIPFSSYSTHSTDLR